MTEETYCLSCGGPLKDEAAIRVFERLRESDRKWRAGDRSVRVPVSDREMFVITAERGEYQDCLSWIVGIYHDRGEAERIAEEKRSKAAVDKAAYNEWCRKRNPLYWAELELESEPRKSLGVLSDEAEARIVETIGSRPCDGWEADEFSVLAIPIGVTGRYHPLL